MRAGSKQERIRDRVLDLVESLRVGEALPSERALSSQWRVARMTVRAAVDELVREGILVRRHGSGTYVAEPKVTQRPGMTSFSRDMRERGLEPGSRTLSTGTISAGARLGRRLRVSPEEEILVFQRLRLADGIPMALETLHVPHSLVPGLSGEDLERHSFYDLLAKQYDITVATGVQTIEPTVTNSEESELLDVPLHSPALLFELSTETDTGRTAEFTRAIYRGDRYRLTVKLDANGESHGTILPR
ncbi:MAG: GntR family transcriptional regulator [Micromonosporaceae bacterium]